MLGRLGRAVGAKVEGLAAKADIRMPARFVKTNSRFFCHEQCFPLEVRSLRTCD